MYVGKPSDQWLLTSHMHGRRGFEMPQPAQVGVMVIRHNVKNTTYVATSYLLGGGSIFFKFWPADLIWIAVNVFLAGHKSYATGTARPEYIHSSVCLGTDHQCWIQISLLDLAVLSSFNRRPDKSPL